MSLAHTWTRERLGEGIYALARTGASTLASDEPPTAPAADDEMTEWVDAAARWIGVEAIAMSVPHPELATFLGSVASAVIRLDNDRFLLVVSTRRHSLRVLGDDGRVRSVSHADVTRELEGRFAETARHEVDSLLEHVELSAPGRARARMIEDRLHDESVGDIWILRSPPATSVAEDLRRARLPGLCAGFVLSFLIDYGLFIASWWLIGRGALRGQMDEGWLAAWALMFVTMVPFRMLATWYEGKIAVAAGGLLKQRLLIGAMRLDPDETRKDGVGRHLARVLESEAVETLAMNGGLVSAAAALQLGVSAVVLALGSGGIVHSLLLVMTASLGAAVSWRYYEKRGAWVSSRLRISHDIVERMVGHRTRLAQLGPEARHESEDVHLSSYLDDSRSADRIHARLAALPRVWLPVSLIAFAPGFILGEATLSGLAVAIGGTLLAYRALLRLVDGIPDLLDAAIAWQRIAPLFHAAGRVPHRGDPSLLRLARPSERADAEPPRLEASELTYRYPSRTESVIRGASFTIQERDRVLLTSPSGGGKSTLISLINGIRRPATGTLFFGGVDRYSLGDEAWTRRIATAPQFHENHIFTEVFAFNVLMGRRWPPEPEDWHKAESLCRELGLGDLLDKMPGGMNQLVGDTGWRLSHGEQSRVFLARALMQGAPLVMLDESFAALDPDTLRMALRCAQLNAESLLVIAHP